MRGVITLGEFILERKKNPAGEIKALSKIMNGFRLAARFIHRELNQSGIVSIEAEGKINVQGEVQHPIDEFTNNQILFAMKNCKQVAGVGSEEMENFVSFSNSIKTDADYVVLFDPLDGSSNIDCNVTVGTIFSVYKRVSKGDLTVEDFTQKGKHQIAAGYILYGPSTVMVYTDGNGVNMFTLDPSVGVFCLTKSQIRCPESGVYYSVNEANADGFPKAVQEYIQFCKSPDPEDARPYQSRYIGSLVADFHRNLLRGGIFMYPATRKNMNGKLRMMYECNPLAFIAEQAGALATDGSTSILEKEVNAIHDRSPLFIGSANMIKDLNRFFRIYG
jgi:fructose-1,6-bisphosphatase I